MVITGKATDVCVVGETEERRGFVVYITDGKKEYLVELGRDQLERLAAQINVALRESDPVGVNGEGE